MLDGTNTPFRKIRPPFACTHHPDLGWLLENPTIWATRLTVISFLFFYEILSHNFTTKNVENIHEFCFHIFLFRIFWGFFPTIFETPGSFWGLCRHSGPEGLKALVYGGSNHKSNNLATYFSNHNLQFSPLELRGFAKLRLPSAWKCWTGPCTSNTRRWVSACVWQRTHDFWFGRVVEHVAERFYKR